MRAHATSTSQAGSRPCRLEELAVIAFFSPLPNARAALWQSQAEAREHRQGGRAVALEDDSPPLMRGEPPAGSGAPATRETPRGSTNEEGQHDPVDHDDPRPRPLRPLEDADDHLPRRERRQEKPGKPDSPHQSERCDQKQEAPSDPPSVGSLAYESDHEVDRDERGEGDNGIRRLSQISNRRQSPLFRKLGQGSADGLRTHCWSRTSPTPGRTLSPSAAIRRELSGPVAYAARAQV
jgi:hypothetical protein